MLLRKKGLLYIKEEFCATRELYTFISRYFSNFYMTIELDVIEKIMQNNQVSLIVLDAKLVNTKLYDFLETHQLENENCKVLFQNEHKTLEELVTIHSIQRLGSYPSLGRMSSFFSNFLTIVTQLLPSTTLTSRRLRVSKPNFSYNFMACDSSTTLTQRAS